MNELSHFHKNFYIDFDFNTARKRNVDKICDDVNATKRQILNYQCGGFQLLENVTHCQINCASLDRYYVNLDIIWLSIESYYADKIRFIERKCKVFVELWKYTYRSKFYKFN